MPEVKDFLSPSAMLTPGIAGGLTVSISLPLAVHFDMSFKWVAMVVSFLFGLLIIYSFTGPLSKPLRALYWVLNSLIIFSVSVGTGVAVDSPPKPPALPLVLEKNAAHPDMDWPSLSQLLHRVTGIRTVFAAEPAPPAAAATTPTDQETNVPPREMEQRVQQLEEARKAAEERAERERELREETAQRLQAYQQQLQRYYRRWSW